MLISKINFFFDKFNYSKQTFANSKLCRRDIKETFLVSKSAVLTVGLSPEGHGRRNELIEMLRNNHINKRRVKGCKKSSCDWTVRLAGVIAGWVDGESQTG